MIRFLAVLAATGCASIPPPHVLDLGPTCAPITIIDHSADTWNRRDLITFESAKHRCGEKYPGSPCLVKFTRIEPGRYTVVCGAKR